jgi:hypothetical protein
MTDQGAPINPGAGDQFERVDALRRRRRAAASSGRRPRRAHPASGSRVGVAAGGLAAMLGLVAAFGLVEKSAGAGPVAPTPGRVVIVIHRNGDAPADGTVSTVVVAPASGPIALTARPIVNAATPGPETPAATTNGSR